MSNRPRDGQQLSQMPVHIQPGGVYAVTNVQGGTCLDLFEDYSAIGCPFNNTSNQAWMFERQQNGNFQIRSATGSYLRIDRPLVDGVRVVAGQAPFEWYVEDDPSVRQAIRLLVPSTEMSLDLWNGGDTTPNTPVVLWPTRWEGLNQVWTLQRIGG